jgi:Gpi18-like mannosyltransferase
MSNDFKNTNVNSSEINFNSVNEKYLDRHLDQPLEPKLDYLPKPTIIGSNLEPKKNWSDFKSDYSFDPAVSSEIRLENELKQTPSLPKELSLLNPQFETQTNPQPAIKKKLPLWLKNLFCFDNLIFVAILVCLLVIRWIFLPVESGDYNNFLKPWIKYIQDNNGFRAFEKKFYDYTPPYVYLLWVGTVLQVPGLLWIKSISIFFEFILAFFIAKIIALKSPKLQSFAFLTTLCLPNVLFNGSWWGQCDVIYTTFVIGALYFILTRKYISSMVFVAIAITLKLQSIFFLPVILLLVITKNMPKLTLILQPVLIGIVYLLAIWPANIMGRSLFDTTTTSKDGLLTIYLNQGNVYKGLAMGPVPNIYQWFDNDKYVWFYPAGIVVAITGVLFILYWVSKAKLTYISNDLIIKFSLLFTLIVPYLLPKMHERYFFLAEIMAVIFAFWFPKKFWIGVWMTLISFSIYISQVISGPIPDLLHRQFNAIWILIIIVYVIYDIVISYDPKGKYQAKN